MNTPSDILSQLFQSIIDNFDFIRLDQKTVIFGVIAIFLMLLGLSVVKDALFAAIQQRSDSKWMESADQEDIDFAVKRLRRNEAMERMTRIRKRGRFG
jgi:hypothetical protein